MLVDLYCPWGKPEAPVSSARQKGHQQQTAAEKQNPLTVADKKPMLSRTRLLWNKIRTQG